jgi:twitching motility two-component system response regulator PilH
MLVDDSPVSLKIAAHFLEKNGLKVILASDGVEAQEKIEASPPDLVIIDIIMPRMNGYDLCRWIKNTPKTQNIPVIICSIKDEEFDRYWGLKQGGDAYISKPVHPPELLETVTRLLRKSKW